MKRKSAKKGLYAAGAGVGTALLFMFTTPVLGVIGLVGTGYLAYDWLRFRGKWGLRF